MQSVTDVAPMAARMADRMCAESLSLQSCKMKRRIHTSPFSGRGSVSERPQHTTYHMIM